jgi:ATP/maltotriose-dependent transcriptional regulator MalT
LGNTPIREDEAMPKAAPYALIWSPERDGYNLYERGSDRPLLRGGDDAWFAWLESHGAFAFQGRSGRLNLLKEARKGGAGYWYAYRRQGTRTRKRYAGRTAELTTGRLEALAGELGMPSLQQEPGVPQTHALELPALLLAPKLQLPRLHADLVARARLLALLDTGLTRKLTLLCAPAGCGKTTLVRQWLALNDERRTMNDESKPHRSSFIAQRSNVAWLSLDTGDNDPIRFWRYIITACQALQADRGQAALALLAAAAQPIFEPLSLEIVLTTFLNVLTRDARGGILVLEDYHVITAPQVHATMAFFLEHLPETLHMIILTRSEPLLPLARLRASGELCEVSAADLRFSQEETQRFFQQALELPLSPEASRQLDERLAGWVAGLRLLVLALQNRASPQAIKQVLATFAGSHRPILEYFIAEVLSVQLAPIQAFLLQTSVLGRLNGSLCDAVLGRYDSAELLAMLDRASLFLEPLDESAQWYRYHALFAEAMQHEARRRFGDAALCRLAQQASLWYEQHGLLAEAVEAALQAQDWARGADLIERRIETPAVMAGLQQFSEIHEFHTLRRWLEQLPETIRQRYPLLGLYYAIALLVSALTERLSRAMEALVERLLDEAEVGLRATNNIPRLGEVHAYRAFICKHRGQIREAVVYARQALDWLPADALVWRTLSLSVVGTGEAFDGHYHEAQQTLLESQAFSEAIGNRTFLRALLGMRSGAFFEQGQLRQVAAYCRQILAEAREEGDRDDIAHALLGLAGLAYEWNDLETALEHVPEAFTLGEQLAYEPFQVAATIVLARVQHVRGQTIPAQQRLATMLARLSSQESPLVYRLHRELLAWQARIALAAGDLAAVRRWAGARAHDVVLPRVQYEQEELLLARLLIAEGTPEAALEMLAPLLPTAQEQGRIRSALEMRAIMALAYADHAQRQEAVRQIRTALATAHTEGFMRLFLDEGEPMAALLAQSIDRRAHNDPLRAYIEQLLAAFRTGGPAASRSPISTPHPALVEPLSPQEQRVLRLLAAGRSNPEIASELVVSVNTIRTHVQSIYRKLDVNNRSAAGDAARRLHLT